MHRAVKINSLSHSIISLVSYTKWMKYARVRLKHG